MCAWIGMLMLGSEGTIGTTTSHSDFVVGIVVCARSWTTYLELQKNMILCIVGGWMGL